MKIHEIISEAIPISQYKKVMHGIDVDYKSRYDNLFNGEMRLYFPLQNTGKVSDALHKHRDSQAEYSHNAILGLLKNNYNNINFETKTVSDKHGRSVKMGKAIANSIAAMRREWPDAPYIRAYIQAFRQWERENQTANKELQAKAGDADQLMVVISRHPYDVAGMSTGREWTSCLDLDSGKNAFHIPAEIKHGTIVAYLTSADDTNLKTPIGRVLIKPYFHVDTWGDTNRSPKHIMFGIEGRTFPPEAKNIPEWLNIVKKWTTKANAKIAKGDYQLPFDLYNDQIPTRIAK